MNANQTIKKHDRKRSKRLLLLATLLFFTIFIWFWLSLPSRLFNTPASFLIEDKDGGLLNASIASDGQWRFPYDENVPDKFIKCITTFEDKRFYSHAGIDAIAFCRAAIANVKGKQTRQGASTLTMQVIRLSRQQTKRTLWAKLSESILAVRLECSYSKKQIMALYASNAPFGSNVVGLNAASWRYYGRDAEKLSWGEMAALAVLPNSPSLVHPGKNRGTLLKKRNELIDKLLSQNIIDPVTCQLSKAEPLPGNPLPLPQLAPHLLQRFKTESKSNPSLSAKLTTTIDVSLQKNIIDILNRHHAVLKGNGINNACALVLDVETGQALSYVGNIYNPINKELESDVDVIKAPRSPGSALKPILYAAALSEGLILPNSIIADIPTQIGGYSPKNYDLSYDGAVPASKALARSLNIPAVKILQQYKYQRFYDLLKQLGSTTLNRPADSYGLSLILGGSEVTMWDLAGMYAGMARTLNHQKQNKGIALKNDFHAPLYFVTNTEPKKNKQSDIINSLDATSIWFTFQAMEEVMRPGEEGLWEQFSSSQRIAWKTGTSFGFRDAWSIGITPGYVVAVWTGNTSGEGRAGLVGVQTAAPIMFDIFRELPSSKWFAAPQNNFIFLPVCRQSGYRANIDCAVADTVMVPANGSRAPLCAYHQLVHLDATGTFRVTENCESPANMKHASWFVLPPTMEWYYKQKNHDYKPLPAFKQGCDLYKDTKQMEMIYPLQNAKIYVPLEIDGQRGKTVFTATHRKAGSKIFWHLDDEYVGTTITYHQLALNPAPGKHLITIVDEQGERVTRSFEILENTNRK